MNNKNKCLIVNNLSDKQKVAIKQVKEYTGEKTATKAVFKVIDEFMGASLLEENAALRETIRIMREREEQATRALKQSNGIASVNVDKIKSWIDEKNELEESLKDALAANDDLEDDLFAVRSELTKEREIIEASKSRDVELFETQRTLHQAQSSFNQLQNSYNRVTEAMILKFNACCT